MELLSIFSCFSSNPGLSDESHVVQNAALFALGQFSEHLQVMKIGSALSIEHS